MWQRGVLVTVAVIWLFTKAPLVKQIFHEKLYALPDPPTLPCSVLKVLFEFEAFVGDF